MRVGYLGVAVRGEGCRKVWRRGAADVGCELEKTDRKKERFRRGGLGVGA